MKKDNVLRHSLSVRLTHWTIAISGFILLFSGIGQMPVYRRYNVIKIPGMGWADNYEITYVMHLVGAVLFTVAIFFHIVYYLRRKEFDAMPKKGDVRESIHIIKAMVTGKKEPPHEKFLAEQRLAYAAIGIVSLVLVVTGLIKVAKNFNIVLEPTFLTIVTLIHTAATPVFLLLVIAHLAAFALKPNWPLLPSMFTGKVSRAYAQERHPLWYAKLAPATIPATETRTGATQPEAATTARADTEQGTSSSSSSAAAAPPHAATSPDPASARK
jgi:formate dehydrogenase gamma subunit